MGERVSCPPEKPGLGNPLYTHQPWQSHDLLKLMDWPWMLSWGIPNAKKKQYCEGELDAVRYVGVSRSEQDDVQSLSAKVEAELFVHPV